MFVCILLKWFFFFNFCCFFVSIIVFQMFILCYFNDSFCTLHSMILFSPSFLHELLLNNLKGGEPTPPTQKNSGLLTQKHLAATNVELYTAVQRYSISAHTKNDGRRIILTQVMSDCIIETTNVSPQRLLGCIS